MRTTLLLGLCVTCFSALADANANWVAVQGCSWTVPDADVKQMAAEIQSAAASAGRRGELVKDVGAYVIQFKGSGPAKRRIVELRGSCEVDGKSRAELRKSFFNVLDGGECYFSATWDATARKFMFFQFNGVA